VGAVHLGVVELERNGQSRFQEAFAVAAPDDEGVVEDAAVHADGAVNIILRQGRCADYHTVGDVVVLTRSGYLPRQPQIVGVEALQVVGERYVAGTYLAGAVGHYRVDRYRVVAHQSVADRQQIELLDLRGGLADTPAHQHVEFQAVTAAESPEARNVKRLEERNHRHRRLHPHLERIRAGGFFRINFLYHRLFVGIITPLQFI